MTIVGVQLQKSARNACVSDPLLRRRSLRFFGHRDRGAEVGDRLFVGRAAQRVLARLAPPLDREIVEPGLSKVTGDRLGFFVLASISTSAASRCSVWRRLFKRLS